MSDDEKVFDVNYYKPVIRKFDRRQIISNKQNDIWGVDLADYSKDPQQGYILVVIDYYTRKVWARVIKTKSEKDITNAIEDIVKSSLSYPRLIHSDLEKGIVYNKHLKSNGVKVYHTDFLGSPIAERAIRSLKELIEPLRDKMVARAWKPVVNKAVELYNDRPHISIGMTPNEAYRNPDDIKHYQTFVKRNEPKNKLKKGEYVAIVLEKDKFTKGYVAKWGDTIYQIDKVLKTNPTTYLLSNGKAYYYQQLQVVKPSR